jgi:hypothetical protein
MPDPKPPKITRRDIDCWLCKLERDILSAMNGPPGELKARLALTLNRVQGWREKLGVKGKA